jgi:hypothetical protein
MDNYNRNLSGIIRDNHPAPYRILSFRLVRNLSGLLGGIPDLPKAFGIAGIDMSQWLTKEHENVTLPFVPSPRGRGGEILSPRPLWERVRVRGGIFGSMTSF